MSVAFAVRLAYPCIGKSGKQKGLAVSLQGAIKLPSLETPPNKHLALKNQWLEDKISSWGPAYVHGQPPPCNFLPFVRKQFSTFTLISYSFGTLGEAWRSPNYRYIYIYLYCNYIVNMRLYEDVLAF